MRIVATIIAVSLLAASCTHGHEGGRIKSEDKTTTEKAVSFMQEQLKSQVSDAEVSVIVDGMITIKGRDRGFMINPATVVTGYIDSDKLEDAILPVYSLSGQSLAGIEYMLLLQSSSGFVIAATMNGVMAVNGIADGVITAVVSTVPTDAPGFGCDECRRTVRYRYLEGELKEVQ